MSTPPVDYYISSSSPSSDDYSYDDPADAGPQLHFLSNKFLVFAIIAFFWVIVLLTSLHIYGRWIRMSRNRNSNAIRSPDQDQSPSANGLSKAVIAQLPTFTYTAPAITDPGTGENAGLSTLECAVCLSEFQENEKGRLLPSCKHSFHIECIDMWFYSHSTCPLCRAKVMMPTITTSPLMPITVNTIEQQQEGEEAPQEASHTAIETSPYAHDNTASAIPDSSNLSHAVQIPTNVLFCGNSTQLLTSQLGSSQSSERPSPSSSAKTTRCIPHITIDIPTCQDINLPSPGCLSLTSRRSRCASPHDVGCSSRTPLKSPGLRESLKRMLNGQSSEGKRVFTSCNQEGSMDDGISKGDSKIAG